MICSANHLTGFYMMVTLAFNELVKMFKLKTILQVRPIKWRTYNYELTLQVFNFVQLPLSSQVYIHEQKSMKNVFLWISSKFYSVLLQQIFTEYFSESNAKSAPLLLHQMLSLLSRIKLFLLMPPKMKH